MLSGIDDVAISHLPIVTPVTNSDAVTNVTNTKNINCNNKNKMNCLTIRELKEMLRLLQLLQQKNSLARMQEINETEFDLLKQFFAEDWEECRGNLNILNLWSEVLRNLKLIAVNASIFFIC